MDYRYRAEQKQQYSIITTCMKETEAFEATERKLYFIIVYIWSQKARKRTVSLNYESIHKSLKCKHKQSVNIALLLKRWTSQDKWNGHLGCQCVRLFVCVHHPSSLTESKTVLASLYSSASASSSSVSWKYKRFEVITCTQSAVLMSTSNVFLIKQIWIMNKKIKKIKHFTTLAMYNKF